MCSISIQSLFIFKPSIISPSYFSHYIYISYYIYTMARTWLALFMLLVLFTSSTNGRKLLNTPDSGTKEEASPATMSLYLSVLPKGTVPASTPSKKSHSSITDEKLIIRHLIAIDRILRSVPSPGVGH
ncbi:hypothetical protein L1987_28899 [Smallanthus sonchifolius]|uniref:Uncharacterized protein n=1 Tax=Smallanthus sonchifolius TaxID=185202 RepID=A0ACB9HZC3_9ASTR|nr:hypothetical protein L1987_28899 [Smallanthus sonchifolius]